MKVVELPIDFTSYSEGEKKLSLQCSPEVQKRPDFKAHVLNLVHHCEESVSALNSHLRFLGFDFALVYQNSFTGKILMAAGHRTTYKIYYRIHDEHVELRSHLKYSHDPFEIASQIDVDWIKYFFATGLSCGPAEVVPVNNSILKSWSRVPPGHLLTIGESGAIAIDTFDNITSLGDSGNESLWDCARNSLDEHLFEISELGPVSCEFSGGIDSGIVLSSASKQLKVFKGGVTAAYPFPEFRRESIFRDSIINFTGSDVAYVNYKDMLPFTHLDKVPQHDEPSINSTSWCQFNATTGLAHQIGAKVLLTGHAGDNLFGIHPLMEIVPDFGRTQLSWIPKNLLDDISDAAVHIANHLNAPLDTSLGGYWHPSILESGYLQRYANTNNRDVRYVSGLMSPRFINALQGVWLQDPLLDSGVQKPIAHHVFSDLLPSEVWRRPGKVNHLGNVYRGAMAASDNIHRLSKPLKIICEVLEIDFNKTFQWVGQICKGHDSGNPFFTQLLSIAIWLDRASSKTH